MGHLWESDILEYLNTVLCQYLGRISFHSVNPAVLRSLFHLNRTLRRLELCEIEEMRVEDYQIFEELLEKLAESLEFIIYPCF